MFCIFNQKPKFLADALKFCKIHLGNVLAWKLNIFVSGTTSFPQSSIFRLSIPRNRIIPIIAWTYTVTQDSKKIRVSDMNTLVDSLLV